MYPRLTKTLIESQPYPEQGQVIIRDGELAGFGLRITPACKSFVVESRINGVKRRHTLGRYGVLTVDVARREAQRLLAEWRLGIDGVGKKRGGPLVGEVLEKYLASRNMKERTKGAYRRLVARLLGDWLQRPILGITKEMIQLRHRELVRPTRCGTDNKACANGALLILNSLMIFAGENEPECKSLATSNPVKTSLKWRWYKMEPRQGVIPDQRLADFFQAIMSNDSKIARDFILLLLMTGLRRSEAATLRWDNIDFEMKTLSISVDDNKSAREHVLPLTDFLVALLRSRKEESEFVFPGRDDGHINEPRGQLEKLRKQMGWQWLLHDLRRTFLSAGEKAGVPYIALKKMANHVIHRDVTDRYIVVDVDFLRPYMAEINNRLLNLMDATIEKWQELDQVDRTKIRSAKMIEREPEEVYW